MKKERERCGPVLAGDAEACICTYECTFCPMCAEEMGLVCPNCRGEPVRRPGKRI